MGRFLLGLFLLAGLLALCLGLMGISQETGLPVAEALEQAAEQTLSGDFSQGIALAQKAYDAWRENWRKTAALADHGPMDDIDRLFAQLKAYAQAGFREDFAALCKGIAKLISSIADSQTPSWWNIL